jgi:hypothetical protein
MEVNVGKTEPAADEPAVAKDLFNLVGRGVRGDIEVLGLAAEQQVTHTAAHEIGVVSMLLQLIENPDSIGTDPLAGDTVFLAGNDSRFNRRHGTVY